VKALPAVGQFVAILLVCGLAAPAQQARLEPSPTLFNVMVAINAAGYDADLDAPSNHPLRAEIRAEIAARKLPVAGELKRFFAAHRRRDWTSELSQYLSFALSVDGSAEYRWRFRDDEIPPDAASLDGFGALMTRFHQQAGLDELWRRVAPVHERALEPYAGPATLMLQQAAAYLRVPASGALGRNFRVFVDLMAAPNHIQARSYGDDFFLVLTSSPEAHLDDIRQAYLAFLVDPYATKHADKLEKKKPLIDLAQAAPLLPEQYKTDFLLLTTKSLVRAIDARLAAASRREPMVKQALGEGYILTPYFFEALAAYEKQEASMKIHYPDMIDAIDLRKEDKRLLDVEFLTAPVERKIKVRAAEEKVELTGARKTLEQAEDLYDARKLADARARYLAAIEEAQEAPLKAKGYFGLARIAALEKNPELSFQLFEKLLELRPDPLVLAWTHVYLGRLSGLAGEDGAAAQHFEDALKVEGASRAVREAAQKALVELKKGR
jgi:tetratricopeptide (TPR) repeat protein